MDLAARKGHFMPSNWKRTPEELHKTYIENTEAFYRVAGHSLSSDLDDFVNKCALKLWSRASSVTEAHCDAMNQLYSRGVKAPLISFVGAHFRRLRKL